MSVDKQQNNSVAISEKRRKLLKASVATPLVASVTFGTGQAAAASAFQCMDKYAEYVPNPNGQPLEADAIINEHTPSTGNPQPFVASDQVIRVEIAQYIKPSAPDAGTYYRIPGDGNTYLSDGTLANPDLSLVTPTYWDAFHMYLPDGGLTSIDVGETWPKRQFTGVGGSRPLFESCYCSLTPGAPVCTP